MKKQEVIVAVSRGHNASTTLMVDGEIIFYLEEERLSRRKYDGCPLLGILEASKYVDHIDHLIVCHTHIPFIHDWEVRNSGCGTSGHRQQLWGRCWWGLV